MNKCNRNIITTVYIFLFIIILIGTTYAYFTAVKVSSVSPSADIKSAKLSILSLNSGDAISIYANEYNFGYGMNSVIDSTYASAYLIAGDTEAIEHYNLSLNISANNFVYSTASKSAEILIRVLDPDGNEITNINGLTYINQNGKKGFDITTKTGIYNIVSNYEIKTSDSLLQTWNVDVTFVNLDEIQDINGEKSLSGYLVIEKV